MASPKFPGPYLNDTRESDPLVRKVNPDTTEIGARPSALPKDGRNDMQLNHVGGTSGKGQ